ncbi:hypothetical protein BHYA_0406g00050 [Botrytis hyacinthi]|uniref:PBP domain-containing protein n=1 Tax=Botrytis hyacinthi TaxID=278943 RepID=A0A4Z1G8Q3_9HELO|nr:hypothetical protein BHYA_0406g00050 [Botrytis hyacinthi]
MASTKVDLTSPEPYITPAEIYSGTSFNIGGNPSPDSSSSTPPITLRIATGGAGQSGLIRALANKFIEFEIDKTGCPRFSIAWLLSDTSASFNYLGSRAADCSITYHKTAEEIALKQGIAERREYAWRDHWLLVGPKQNPASLPLDSTDDSTIFDLFGQLFMACVENPNIRFLSRYDKSAANIKESSIWTAIGQTPWAHPYSSWYHRYIEFPFAALRAACALGEYTLTDKGTWLSIEEEIRDKMSVFKASTDAPDDPLLNPAHILVGTRGKNIAMAHKFADWMIARGGGQKVIEEFEVNGAILYTGAPNSSKVRKANTVNQNS